MFVILKWVTSAPSTGLREMTRPEVVWTFTDVAALVTDGVSATGFTVIVAVVPPPTPSPAALVADCATKLPVPNTFGGGVNFRPAPPSATVMTALLAIGV